MYAEACRRLSQRKGRRSTLPQVAKAWVIAGRPDAADWPLQQLRERLMSLEALGEDKSQQEEVRCAAQLLQFYTLQGSIVLAMRAGHQALWSNLIARMQRLLDACLLAPADVAQLCQELADTLTAQTAANAEGAVQPGAGRTPVQLLQCAEALIAHSVQLVEQAMQASDAQGSAADEASAMAVWLQQLNSAHVEVG